MTLPRRSRHQTLADGGDAAAVAAAVNDAHCERGPSDMHLIRALAESAPVAIYHADSAGHLTYANPQYRAMFGLAADQSLDDWAQAMHPTDRPRLEAAWAEFFRRWTKSIRFEYRNQSSTGEIRHLAEHVVAVSAEGVNGFVGTITDVTELKQAQAELEALHKQLNDASRLAGRAEIATSVLHNVGNVLNSVNVSADLAASRIRNSRLLDLNRVASLLEANEASLPAFFGQDERGKRLPGYLGKLARQAGLDQEQVLAELAELKNGIDHIKDIVAMQQNYAKLGGVADVIDVISLVEDSLRLNESALARHGIMLRRQFEDAPTIVVDKHRVLQILVNLIRNAKQACHESDCPEKIVTVRVATSRLGVQVSVIDNGVGIAPGNLTRIFSHGFTTKKEGHGFGLHSGALTARELGGQLRVESAGPGQGATFSLDLPLTPVQADHE
jgi:PAS domain S-box-containing protein